MVIASRVHKENPAVGIDVEPVFSNVKGFYRIVQFIGDSGE